MGDRQLHFLGHSAFEIISEKGTRVLLDPYIINNAACPYRLEDIQNPDLILVSHAAADHLGDTLELAKKTGCDVLAAADVATFLVRNGIDKKKIKRAVWGNIWDYKGLRIRVVESHHISWMEYQGGVLSGVPLGFILYTESGLGIYHPGDTSISSDLKLLI